MVRGAAIVGPVKAAQTKFIVEDAERNDVCSICGDDPAQDYRLEKPFRPAGGSDTLKLCKDCFEMRRVMGEPFEVIQSLGENFERKRSSVPAPRYPKHQINQASAGLTTRHG